MVRDDNAKVLPQYVAALSAAGGAFALGTCLGWTSPVQEEITKGDLGFPVNDDEFSWVGSMFNLGAACVCIPIGFMIQLIGRKTTMLLLVLPFTVGWALLIWPDNVNMLFIGRYVVGVAGGAFCVTAPMYTGEIALKEVRGTLGTFFQLMITIGILFVFVVGYVMETFMLSLVCGVLPLIFGLIFLFMPETPMYYVSKSKPEKAIKSVQWLRGDEYDYKPEIAELQSSDAKVKEQSVSYLQSMTNRVALKALFIGLGLMFFQQMSGINAVMFYMAEIFAAADTGIDPKICTIIIAVCQVVATFISSLVVDKAGRRLLLLSSAIVMAMTTAAIGVYFFKQQKDGVDSVKELGWLPLTSLCLFIIMFSFGFGPVPWLMMGEIFPSEIKGVAGSIAGTFNWVLAFVVTKTFVNLNDMLGKGETFWLFSAITVVGVLFVFFCVPETKGKSLNEIQEMLKGNKED